MRCRAIYAFVVTDTPPRTVCYVGHAVTGHAVTFCLRCYGFPVVVHGLFTFGRLHRPADYVTVDCTFELRLRCTLRLRCWFAIRLALLLLRLFTFTVYALLIAFTFTGALVALPTLIGRTVVGLHAHTRTRLPTHVAQLPTQLVTHRTLRFCLNFTGFAF